ncbi:MAG TPA: lysine--tRNA ligase [Phycisphaerae bacterium]|nr:lysine--tRNA ligase [Phycisphaerae bacterium]
MSTSENPQFKDRVARLQKWKAAGVDPYGQRTDGLMAIAEARGLHKGVDITPHDGEAPAKVAGRIVLFRDIGKLIFLTIQDWTGRIQVGLAKQGIANPDARWPQAKLLELGDIAAFSGKVGHTKTGEITLWANDFSLLTKALLPPPDKFHGLADTELRYRQRYVDLLANPDSLDTFLFRSQIVDTVRSFLKERSYVEVETPLMQAIAGGAAARPFVTHHNALDIDLFLRISPELYLKRLLVGGMERVFDINRNFRNEGIDTTHNPEFTMLECYQAYSDLGGMMELTESLIVGIVKQRRAFLASNGSSPDDGGFCLPFGDRVIDYKPPFARAAYAELFRQHAGVEMFDVDAVRGLAGERGVADVQQKDHDVIVGELFEQLVEPALAGLNHPVFVYDYPAALCPLTKRKSGDPRLAERFELYIVGIELANAYSELNDPAIQEATFSKQLEGQKEEDSMAKMDHDFINALRYGMPPAGGLGIGIDRLVMLMTNKQSIRDVVLFPLLKPTQETLADVEEERMERDARHIERDIAKAHALNKIPVIFVQMPDGSLRAVDL